MCGCFTSHPVPPPCWQCAFAYSKTVSEPSDQCQMNRAKLLRSLSSENVLFGILISVKTQTSKEENIMPVILVMLPFGSFTDGTLQEGTP